ncbi:MAG: type II CAAX endopeptidase family protein [Pseudomonadota bacterium]
MRNLAEIIAFYRQAILPPGAKLVSLPLAFLSIAIVALFEFPAHFITQAGYVDLGILTNEIIAVAGVPLILILWLKLSREKLLPFISLRVSIVALLVVFMFGADIIIDYLTAASEIVLPLPQDIKDMFEKVMAAPSADVVMCKFFVLCVVPAVCEEIFFRGFFQTSLTARLGVGKAVLITSVVFAIMHGNFYYVHLYIMLGLIFGWVYAVTGSLWAPIICHVFNNSWTFFNHVRGFKLPLPDVPVYVNALIVSGGALLLIATLLAIRSLSRNKIQ